MTDEREFVVAVTGRDIMQAEFFKGLLEGNEVPAIIMDENSEALGMPMSILSQGVPVLVPSDMLAEARRIIDEHRSHSEDELAEEAEQTPAEE